MTSTARRNIGRQDSHLFHAAVNAPAGSATMISVSPSHDAASFATSAVHSSSLVANTASSFGWAGLPAELFVAVAGYLPSYRFLLPLSSVNRRLHRLVYGSPEPAAKVAGECTISTPHVLCGSSRDVSITGMIWRSQPILLFTVHAAGCVKVDGVRAVATLASSDMHSFVSRTLTTFRYSVRPLC